MANSKKYGERCIAGVEIVFHGSGKYSVTKVDSQPKWVRPVSQKGHGEVSVAIVGTVQLLDIVEIEIIEECPQGYQSENFFSTRKACE